MPWDAGLTPHVLLYRIMWMTSARCMRRTGTARTHSASRWAVLSTSSTSWPCELVMKRMRTKQTPLAAVPSRSGLLLSELEVVSGFKQTMHQGVCGSCPFCFCHGMLLCMTGNTAVSKLTQAGSKDRLSCDCDAKHNSGSCTGRAEGFMRCKI